MALLYIYGSVILVSLIAIAAILPLLVKKETPENVLLLLLSLSVGTLLGGAFLHFLPEAITHGYTLGIALYIFMGFLSFFVLEKLVHHHHSHEHGGGHGHAYHLAPINLIGDGVHNFVDGLVIAGSYLVSIPLGLAATASVLFHEVPQEIADFGILLYAGWSKKKAVLFNFLSAIMALVGATIGILLSNVLDWFSELIVPFAAGMFIYIAASNLIPELHKENKPLQTLSQLLAMLTGIGIMVAIALYGPGH